MYMYIEWLFGSSSLWCSCLCHKLNQHGGSYTKHKGRQSVEALTAVSTTTTPGNAGIKKIRFFTSNLATASAVCNVLWKLCQNESNLYTGLYRKKKELIYTLTAKRQSKNHNQEHRFQSQQRVWTLYRLFLRGLNKQLWMWFWQRLI